ncbi:MAG TPA: hypothetical protein VG184_06525 [Acidimicrobiales bacterium]|nr:hypothetical protein [Acidimicrobiales bacterium]
MVEDVARIGKRAHQEGLTAVSFHTPKTDLVPARAERITEAVVEHDLASIQDTDRAVGSVAGVLDVINLRRGNHHVSLYDDETRRAVRCRFPDELFTTMKDALGKRVRAFGEVTRNRSGQILQVDIDRVEALAEATSVPTVDELAGIAEWYTGDQSTEDYLRSVRGA